MPRWPFVAVVLLTLGVASPVFAQDPHVGIWKLNVAKSKSDATPTPRSETRTYAMFGDGLKLTVETINANGTRTTGGYSAHFDGKDSPLTGLAGVDTIALKRIDASAFEATLKQAGKVISTVRNVVSKDAKMMTVTVKGSNSGVLVFEKQ